MSFDYSTKPAHHRLLFFNQNPDIIKINQIIRHQYQESKYNPVYPADFSKYKIVTEQIGQGNRHNQHILNAK